MTYGRPHALLLSSQPYLDRGASKLILNHRMLYLWL